MVLHVFNYGVKPVWEDSSVDKGMHLEMKTQNQQTSKCWEDLLTAMLGEKFQKQSKVVGLVFRHKTSFDKIAIWMTVGTSDDEIKALKADIVKFT